MTLSSTLSATPAPPARVFVPMTIARVLDPKATDHKQFGVETAPPIVQAILDHLQVGTLVVDVDWHVWFANRAALRECSGACPLQVERGTLCTAGDADRHRVGRAIRAAQAGRWSLVRLESTAAGPFTFAVVPMWPSELGAIPPALFLFGSSHASYPLAIQLFAEECGLTPAETKVARCLAQGLRPKQIADSNRVLLSTVRTQIGSIRMKTGARSIADLMSSLAGLPPVMPAVQAR